MVVHDHLFKGPCKVALSYSWLLSFPLQIKTTNLPCGDSTNWWHRQIRTKKREKCEHLRILQPHFHKVLEVQRLMAVHLCSHLQNVGQHWTICNTCLCIWPSEVYSQEVDSCTDKWGNCTTSTTVMWDTTSMKRILSNPLPQGCYYIKIQFEN
jgi:hypothetical protein